MEITRKKLVLCLLLAILLAISHISREVDIRVPSLSLLVPGYLFCFVFCATWKKGVNLIRDENPDPWDPVAPTGRTWILSAISVLYAFQFILGRLSRAYTPNTQDSWAIDIWNAFIPFFVAIIQRSITDETLVVSGGTSLAMVAACVIMLPFEAFGSGAIANSLAILENICTAGALVMSQELLKKEEHTDGILKPVDLLLNISVIIPFFLFLPVGFLEVPLLLAYSQRDWQFIVAKLVLDALLLCHIHLLTFELLKEGHILLVSVVFSVGTALAIAVTNSVISLVGLLLVIICFSAHIKLMTLTIKELS